MNIDPIRYAGRPADKRIPAEEAIYDKLEELSIPFDRCDHDHADTMEDCLAIEQVLGGRICKNLFLCNRQQTEFYLVMMPGDKPFKTKEISSQINSARLSFASAEEMEAFLDITPGSVSIMGLMNDKDNRVKLLVDKDVLAGEFLGCHPCINTSSLKLRTSDAFGPLLKAMHHDMTVVTLIGE